MRAPLCTLTYATILATVAGCSGGTTLPTRVAAPSLERAAPCGWGVAVSAKPNSTNANLYGVGGSDAADLWAVGAYESSASFRTFAEHWDGADWKLVQTPSAGTGDNNLVAVTAPSSTNAWAVGRSTPTSTSETRTLIEHWDGKEWKIVTSPSSGQGSWLGDVKAVAANDVWAVGAFYNLSGNLQTLVEHWNGNAWSIVSSPDPGGSYNDLAQLAIVTPKNIWAAGSSSNDSGATSQTLVERWNGKTWQIVPSLNAPNAIYSDLGSIAAVDASDIWVAGSSESYASYTTSTLVERWSGSSWQIVPSPNVGTHGSVLSGIAAVSAGELWAVGSYIDPSDFLPRTLIERWNGKTWRVAKSPDPGAVEDLLHGVAVVGTTAWSVGSAADSAENEPLIMRFTCPV